LPQDVGNGGNSAQALRYITYIAPPVRAKTDQSVCRAVFLDLGENHADPPYLRCRLPDRPAAVHLARGCAGAEVGPAAPVQDSNAILLTIFLRHDQSKTLDEINDHLRQTGYYAKFPPEGVEVVSWYVMMGVGQVVTLRVPPDRLREVNRVIEETAWGGYRTEFYPTYDYKQLAEQERKKAK
jgi:hypothetical protein